MNQPFTNTWYWVYCSSRKKCFIPFFPFSIRWWASVGCPVRRTQQRWPTTSSTMAFLYQARQLPRCWTQWIRRPWHSPWATLSNCKQNVSTASFQHLTSRQIDRNIGQTRHANPKHMTHAEFRKQSWCWGEGSRQKGWESSLLSNLSETLPAGRCLFRLQYCSREREKLGRVGETERVRSKRARACCILL